MSSTGAARPAVSRSAVTALAVAVAVLAVVCGFLLVQNHRLAAAVEEASSTAQMAEADASFDDSDTLDAVNFLCQKVALLQKKNGLSAVGVLDASGDGDPCAI